MNLFRSKNGNSTNHKFTQRALLLIPLAVACFALLPQALAVVPPPDGGYPNFNTAEGQNALFSLSTGSLNTAVGWSSLFSNAVGSFNTATGAGSLLFNTGDDNSAFGAAALLSNTTGIENTANGAFALVSNNGASNTGVGAYALNHNTTGDRNTAVGDAALFGNTTGHGNVALGVLALATVTTGIDNIALGNNALQNTIAFRNIALGGGAGFNVSTAHDVICIGTNGQNVDNSCYIGQIYGASIDPTNSLVGVDLNGKLGVTTSARRFKRDIQPMENASKAILALKPVTFHYKGDVKSIPCFGLVAEDVEKVNPDLIVRDKNGEPLSVRYEQINAMLLNEFLKEHRRNQEQEATIAELRSTVEKQEAANAKQQKQIEALTKGLQKVSAQLEVSKPAPQTVLND